MRRGQIDELLAFATIPRARSFTRVAAELNVSPSALSHTIKGLEKRLGLQLLARTTLSVAPTPAGEILLRSVESAIREVETGLAALGDWQSEPSGAIRLTAFAYPTTESSVVAFRHSETKSCAPASLAACITASRGMSALQYSASVRNQGICSTVIVGQGLTAGL
jgi:DNA-binding Lrp family transcriptional regulator